VPSSSGFKGDDYQGEIMLADGKTCLMQHLAEEKGKQVRAARSAGIVNSRP
jgi:hypothetical protein